MPDTVYAASIDADDCMFNKNYTQRFYNEDNTDLLIECNQILLSHIKEQQSSYNVNYVLVGSNRQSHRIDRANSILMELVITESCFSAIEKIGANLGARVDKFLLADVHSYNVDGYSFDQAVQATTVNPLAVDHEDLRAHPDWIFDESKLTIIYAQVHRLASKHPEARITYDFYDDRTDIAPGIRKCMSHELLPRNVTIRFFKYAGNAVSLLDTMHGSGMIDHNYRETVNRIAYECAEKYSIRIDKIDVANNLSPTCLRQLIKGEEPSNTLKTDVEISPAEYLDTMANFDYFTHEEPLTDAKTVFIAAIDTDGCTHHAEYQRRFWHENPKEHLLIDCNQPLLSHITAAKVFHQVAHVMIGSNRQSYKIDRTNSIARREFIVSESCFHALEKIGTHLGARVDKFLLADLYSDKPHGYCFDQAKRAIEAKPIPDKNDFEDHENWIFDESKVTIIYAQVHKAASKYPTARITYHFYDDIKDLGPRIQQCLSPEAIPNNVTICFFLYNGTNEPLHQNTIQGIGGIDHDYGETVKRIAKHLIPAIGTDLSGYLKLESVRPMNVARKLKSEEFLTLTRRIPVSSTTLVLPILVEKTAILQPDLLHNAGTKVDTIHSELQRNKPVLGYISTNEDHCVKSNHSGDSVTKSGIINKKTERNDFKPSHVVSNTAHETFPSQSQVLPISTAKSKGSQSDLFHAVATKKDTSEHSLAYRSQHHSQVADPTTSQNPEPHSQTPATLPISSNYRPNFFRCNPHFMPNVGLGFTGVTLLLVVVSSPSFATLTISALLFGLALYLKNDADVMLRAPNNTL